MSLRRRRSSRPRHGQRPSQRATRRRATTQGLSRQGRSWNGTRPRVATATARCVFAGAVQGPSNRPPIPRAQRSSPRRGQRRRRPPLNVFRMSAHRCGHERIVACPDGRRARCVRQIGEVSRTLSDRAVGCRFRPPRPPAFHISRAAQLFAGGLSRDDVGPHLGPPVHGGVAVEQLELTSAVHAEDERCA